MIPEFKLDEKGVFALDAWAGGAVNSAPDLSGYGTVEAESAQAAEEAFRLKGWKGPQKFFAGDTCIYDEGVHRVSPNPTPPPGWSGYPGDYWVTDDRRFALYRLKSGKWRLRTGWDGPFIDGPDPEVLVRDYNAKEA